MGSALVRIDLPLGTTIETPAGARICTPSGKSIDAEFLSLAPNVDPQMQGRGFLFLAKANNAQLLTGEPVIGYLKVPGEPQTGVIVPRDAVVRTEGSGWVYVLDTNGAEAFTRTEIALDYAMPAGWFVTKGVAPGNYVVVKGAQQLLSIELKGQGSGGGD
jgi:hypothetical protein